MGRGADVHVGVVQNEVLEVDKLALEPQCCGRVSEVLAFDEPFADQRAGQPLVEPRQNLGGCRFYFPISNAGMSCGG
ncbi:msl9407 (plasmid) [Mesorhizobium japonicum MAFF 303099]|uniref:Msl9407 protein n=1 Tax=Mesorhizobium japonicum (strain LMG 29417 / CECT 9101 / MAFF 303099) TaxID=266835 RepID=Q981I0_RHILO|nr:msl9407 [Mesorhizobium japonicum MAFF 303099]